MTLLTVNRLKKIYGKKGHANQIMALKDINFEIQSGEFVAIMGESGSGKSTLLNIIATFDTPTTGQVLLNNQDISQIKRKKLAEFRRSHLGFVFQQFNILNNFSNKDNMLLPLVLSGVPIDEMEFRVKETALSLGISELLDKYPHQISGGQLQRVAIGRAIITKPELLLADEPTGSLDSNSSSDILKIFQQLQTNGQTILMVTHSTQAASKAQRVLFIKDGIVYHEIYKGEPTDVVFEQHIVKSLAFLNHGKDLTSGRGEQDE